MSAKGYLAKGLWAAAMAALLLLGSSCSYRGGVEDPFVRKTAWFSFLNGDDLRRACRPGVPPQYRLVYNARFDKHVRAYDVVGDGAGGAFVTARAEADGNLANLTAGDLLAPYRWQVSRVEIGPAELARLEAALAASGFFEPAPSGLRLESRRFYWVGIGCRDGRITFHAWQYPEGWQRLAFPQVLASLDRTGVPIPEAHPVDPGAWLFEDRGRKGEGDTVHFDLTVGEKGFRGLWTPF